eukprot:CAMPEP_0180392668 /NCGR_PEP_ID=MMETSP0989-20121125/33290_1 /TAXON_ID=697907 /ORGANISM="non described non described, Strain CCMP2293" /LENGTH=42 /DNA_ID= /DNA_START= /DNA_END= /DNA_ORIENTATION=
MGAATAWGGAIKEDGSAAAAETATPSSRSPPSGEVSGTISAM